MDDSDADRYRYWFLYLLTDRLDTVGIVRHFVIEVVHVERVEHKIEKRWTRVAGRDLDQVVRWISKFENFRFESMPKACYLDHV